MQSQTVFSLLRRIFSKERQSLKHDTLEILLHIGLDNDQSKERYGDAVEMFLKEYPQDTIRKKKRRLQGHVYPSNRVSLKNVAMMQLLLFSTFLLTRNQKNKLMPPRMYYLNVYQMMSGVLTMSNCTCII